jgi:hypothetical protein
LSGGTIEVGERVFDGRVSWSAGAAGYGGGWIGELERKVFAQ